MAIGHTRSSSRSRRAILWAYSFRAVAFSLIAFLTMQGTIAAGAQQEHSQQQQPPAPSQSQASNAQQTSAPPMMPVDPPVNADQNSLPSEPMPQAPASEQQEPAQQPAAPQQPVGTAAAPYEKPTGVPGSRPAGAVIAPAKQRRVRAIVVKVSIILAAGAAVGVVAGLSKASHSQPQ